ncbi:hypothetical protein FB45DRAFT_878530 [Roridomyces roridus]|uniref:Uncharacterized protein n=1 Tax=Roridomyces roridus TaxID=1738132 RepID=A0AAD7B057_9AGAR|nr:hypothetical protein FB45DRAFT_878530 [Roridomyces roridus]
MVAPLPFRAISCDLPRKLWKAVVTAVDGNEKKQIQSCKKAVETPFREPDEHKEKSRCDLRQVYPSGKFHTLVAHSYAALTNNLDIDGASVVAGMCRVPVTVPYKMKRASQGTPFDSIRPDQVPSATEQCFWTGGGSNPFEPEPNANAHSGSSSAMARTERQVQAQVVVVGKPILSPGKKASVDRPNREGVSDITLGSVIADKRNSRWLSQLAEICNSPRPHLRSSRLSSEKFRPSFSRLLPGPTINIHTLAKPLMKVMYHRQALGFIAKDGVGPLSAEMVEIYSTYLSCKYVLPETRIKVMDHLARRASRHEESARQILCSLATTPIPHLLIHKDLQMAPFSLIAALLARRFSPSLPPTGLLPDAKEALGSNARSEMESDRETVVTPVLGAISEHSDGVGILALFASNIPQVRRWACTFVSKASLQLHHHFRKVFGEAVIQAVCNLAGDPQEIVAVHAILRLDQIVQADYLCSYDIVATALFDRMWDCGNVRVISEACCLVSSLVTRGFTVDYILDEAGIGKLVKLEDIIHVPNSPI